MRIMSGTGLGSGKNYSKRYRTIVFERKEMLDLIREIEFVEQLINKLVSVGFICSSNLTATLRELHTKLESGLKTMAMPMRGPKPDETEEVEEEKED